MKHIIIIFLLFLLVAILVALYCYLEAHFLKVNQVTLTKSETKKNDSSVINKITSPSIATSKKSINVVFFSDLHAEFCFVPASRIINAIDNAWQSEKIDAVIFGGDICNNPKGAEKGIKYLNALKEHLDARNIPFLGTTGNHDAKLQSEAINSCKFVNLNNSSFEIDGFEFRAVDDSGRKNRVWGNNPFTSHENTNILISHNPDWILDACDKKSLENIDYMLSGHIHGGQIRMPFGLENILFRKDELPKRKVIKGVFDGAGVKFFISVGIGCVLVPFRLLSRPEITLIKIEKVY